MDINAFFRSLDLSTSEWLLAGSIAIGSFVVFHAILVLIRKKLCKLGDESHAHRPYVEILKATLGRTSNFTVLAFAILLGLNAITLPPPWDIRVGHLWFIALGIQIALYLNGALVVTLRRYFHRHAKSDSPETVAHTLILWAVQSAVWVVFLLAMLSNLGINVTTFVASLGIGGVAVALAVQNILGDLFASLSIAVDKPFEVGDSISVDDFSGTVEAVGLKTTRIRSDSGEQIVISNTDLLKKTVRNYKRMTERRVQFTLHVSPDTPRDKAEQVPVELRKIIEAQDHVRFNRAHLKSVEQNFLEFEVVYFVLDPRYAVYMDSRHAIMLGTIAMLEQLDVTTGGAAQHWVIDPPDGYARQVGSRSQAGMLASPTQH
ncbi:MAG TPA: mechanosensitive ion channel family protein [Burkholderiaceae bacterium]